MSVSYEMTKVFDDYPCAHRSWAHDGRCRFLHGYERSFTVTFVASELEADTGFVIDFGGLKDVRALLAEQFDHTTVVAIDDPEVVRFQALHDAGILDLRLMHHPGMEGAARWVLERVGQLVCERTAGRVRVTAVEARESRKNAVTARAHVSS